jgi:peptide/bleomycin uptake transporter
LQFGVVLPYIILVPCISKGGITLGSLQRLVGAFNNVERSFQFLVRNWGQMLAGIAETDFFR